VLPINVATEDNNKELIIPLFSDTAFFQLLSTALQSFSAYLLSVHSDFITILQDLSRNVSQSARPASSSSSFHPHSASSNPAAITVSSSFFASGDKSDLYSWRELFQLYLEAEVFESVNEVDRGERSVEDSETRLRAFLERVMTRGLAKKLKVKQSRIAFDRFLGLNIFILNVKKVCSLI
jgi:hypothetical protein